MFSTKAKDQIEAEKKQKESENPTKEDNKSQATEKTDGNKEV